MYVSQPLHLSHGTSKEGAEQQAPTIFHVGRYETAEETHYGHHLRHGSFGISNHPSQSEKGKAIEETPATREKHMIILDQHQHEDILGPGSNPIVRDKFQSS